MSQFAFADIRGADRRNDYVEGAPQVQAEQVEVGVVPVDLSERAQVLLSAFQDGNSEASSEEINEAGEVHRPRRAPRGEPPEPREREDAEEEVQEAEEDPERGGAGDVAERPAPDAGLQPPRFHVPQRAREVFAFLWAQHGRNWSVQDYHLKTRIPIKRVYEFRKKLERGEDISLSTVKRGRRRILATQDSINMANALDRNCALTLREMQGIITTNASLATISRHLKSSHMAEHGVSPYTLKKVAVRALNANSDAIKDLRISVMRRLISLQSSGLEGIYIDETHWELTNIRTRGYAPVGHTPLMGTAKRSLQFTSITAITSNGEKWAEMLKGKVTADVFIAAMHHLIDWRRNVLGRDPARNTAFIFLDNASIHRREDVSNLFESAGYVVLFNAPHSSPMNPIEYIFGIWKNRAKQHLRENHSDDEILAHLAGVFDGITENEIRATISHVTSFEMVSKVNGREDL